jgi:hypothetical protein
MTNLHRFGLWLAMITIIMDVAILANHYHTP